MALKQLSLFLYGFQVTALNRSIDFRAVVDEEPRLATLRLGNYSLSALMREWKRAMEEVDQDRTYTVTADRSVAGGLENRVTIATSGDHLQLLGATGPRAASTALPLLGFEAEDLTGATEYESEKSCGVALIPTRVAFNYIPPDMYRNLFGNVNITVRGRKEAIVHSVQEYWQAEWRYEPLDFIRSDWNPFIEWAISLRLFEFTPDVTEPDKFFEGTFEKTTSDPQGFGFKWTIPRETLPGFFNTGLITFRVNPDPVGEGE